MQVRPFAVATTMATEKPKPDVPLSSIAKPLAAEMLDGLQAKVIAGDGWQTGQD